MRTTLTIDDHLVRQLKQTAQGAGTSFKQVVNMASRIGLDQMQRPTKKRHYRVKTFAMGRPVMVLDKALALSSALEDEEVARKLALRK
jgi:hypothetical protein